MQNIPFNSSDIFGFFAATLTSIAFLPQLFRTWNTKSADDISYKMLILFLLGVCCWIIYGIQINSFPVLIANVVTFTLNALILIFKIYYSKILAKS